MVPKLHKKGSSFKGAAAYLLHDKNRAKTSQRIAWAETRNLATRNPETAWKVMAATALKREDLKVLAKVKNTGRKSVDSVLHFSLAWHPEEKADLSRDEMRRAAIGALKALKADDRQVLIICHNDEPHPHIHILVNRVSPADGRMLSSSNEKLELSKWAETYEKERGQVYCEDRVLNNGSRARKKHTRGKKDQARHLYEAAQEHELDEKEKVELRRKEAILARAVRDVQKRQKNAWAEFEKRHKERVKEIKAQAVRETELRKVAVRASFRPKFQTMFQKHQTGMAAFLQKEKTLLGRVHNALRAIDFAAIVRGAVREKEGGSRRGALGQAFDALSKAGVRLEALKRQQAIERRSLEARENQAEREEAVRICRVRDAALQRNREGYEKERNSLIFVQQMDAAKIRTERMVRTQLRAQVQEDAGRQLSLPSPETQRAFPSPEPQRERVREAQPEPQSRRRYTDRDRDR